MFQLYLACLVVHNVIKLCLFLSFFPSSVCDLCASPPALGSVTLFYLAFSYVLRILGVEVLDEFFYAELFQQFLLTHPVRLY